MRVLWVGVVLCLSAPWVQAEHSETPIPSADEVVRQVKNAFGRIEDYSVRVGVEVDIEGFEFPDREVTLFFKRPDRIHLEGAEFAMLPREGLMADPSQLLDTERFQIEMAGVDTLEGRDVYVLRLLPRSSDEAAMSELTAWVDGKRWVIVRMEAFEEGRKQGLVTIQYERVGEEFWLPFRTGVDIYMESVAAESATPAESDSSSSARSPEKGTIHLTFRDYQINVGLPDSLFVSP